MNKEILKATIGIIAFIVGATLIVYIFGGDDVYSDDTENDLGLCLNYHIQTICDKLDIEKLMLNLTERAHEWNQYHGNKTLEFECLTNDSLERIPACFNQTASGQMTMCVDDLQEYFKARLQHINDTDFIVVYPCPPLDLKNITEDESGK